MSFFGGSITRLLPMHNKCDIIPHTGGPSDPAETSFRVDRNESYGPEH
jgi:hypothetical protein